MLCLLCLTERDDKYFLMGSTACFKCVYERKAIKESQKAKVHKCRVCGNACTGQRWIYCSKKCSELGELKQNKEYWVRMVKSV